MVSLLNHLGKGELDDNEVSGKKMIIILSVEKCGP